MFDIIKQIYLNSIFYDKKISSKITSELKYKPSSYLLSSIVKIRTKKFNIKNFLYDNFWTNKKLNQKQLQKMNNFYWLFSLDLKSSNKICSNGNKKLDREKIINTILKIGILK